MAFTTSKTFTVAIENIAKDLNITHMDAILYYCDKEVIEPDSVGSLISKGLAAASFVAASLSPSNLNRRVEEDGYKKDDGSN